MKVTEHPRMLATIAVRNSALQSSSEHIQMKIIEKDFLVKDVRKNSSSLQCKHCAKTLCNLKSLKRHIEVVHNAAKG